MANNPRLPTRRLHVIIPIRAGGNADLTLASLKRSTYWPEMSITVQHDHWGNANRCRNEGFKRAPESELILFSDDDIDWEPGGIAAMVRALDEHPEMAYAFGAYEMGGVKYCMEPFNADALRRRNLASTMSVIRRVVFERFMWDEELERLQDYGLWVNLLNNGHVGINVGTLIFRTARRDGITQNGKVGYAEAWNKIISKYGTSRVERNR